MSGGRRRTGRTPARERIAPAARGAWICRSQAGRTRRAHAGSGRRPEQLGKRGFDAPLDMKNVGLAGPPFATRALPPGLEAARLAVPAVVDQVVAGRRPAPIARVASADPFHLLVHLAPAGATIILTVSPVARSIAERRSIRTKRSATQSKSGMSRGPALVPARLPPRRSTRHHATRVPASRPGVAIFSGTIKHSCCDF